MLFLLIKKDEVFLWLQGADYLSYLGHSVIYFRVVEQNRLPSWLISRSPPGHAYLESQVWAVLQSVCPSGRKLHYFFCIPRNFPCYCTVFIYSAWILTITCRLTHQGMAVVRVRGASLCSSSSVCSSLWPPGLLLNVHLPLHLRELVSSSSLCFTEL